MRVVCLLIVLALGAPTFAHEERFDSLVVTLPNLESELAYFMGNGAISQDELMSIIEKVNQGDWKSLTSSPQQYAILSGTVSATVFFCMTLLWMRDRRPGLELWTRFQLVFNAFTFGVLFWFFPTTEAPKIWVRLSPTKEGHPRSICLSPAL